MNSLRGITGLSGWQRDFPLTGPGIVIGTVGGLAAAALFQSLLIGFSILVLGAVVGMVWRRDEVPILSFCLAYQWLFTATGYVYDSITGVYPGFLTLGDIHSAVFLSLLGLVAAAVGIRVVFWLWPPALRRSVAQSAAADRRLNLTRCFWLVIVTSALSWGGENDPKELWTEGSEVIGYVLAFRAVLLGVLVLEVVKQRRGYGLAVVAVLCAIVPETLTGMSRFSGPLFLVFVVLMSQWRPWAREGTGPRRIITAPAAVAAVSIVLIVLALGWQGGVKARWRPALTKGEVEGSRVERVFSFIEHAWDGLTDFQLAEGTEHLVQRMSSGVGFFSFVMERVPDVVPFQDGALTWRAVEHVIAPRLLFPNKANLGSDSWLIWVFAGVPAAGEDEGTSIGLGYIPEFYIDFGVPVMFLGVFAVGVFVAVCYNLVAWCAPSRSFHQAAVIVVFLQNFMNYEAELAKFLGGMRASVVIFGALLFIGGPWLHARLSARPPVVWRRAPAVPAALRPE